MVDDETPILKITRRILEIQGYQVVTARTPDEAIRLAQSHAGAIHLFMTDVIMLEMKGADLAPFL